MMKWVLIVFCLGLANLSWAVEYYVGGTGASDSNPGTATQPFATIQKAASLAKAGDIVNIRSGTYRETIIPANSGSGGSPIIFRPDAGASVTISGLEVISNDGWSVHNGNIYKKSITLPVNGFLAGGISTNTDILANQVLRNGEQMIEARWPDGIKTQDDLFDMKADGNIATSGWRYLSQFGASQTIQPGTLSDQALSAFPGGSLVGTSVVIQGWYIRNSATIKSHSGSTINYDMHVRNFLGGPFLKYYYLTGHLQFLNQEREFHYQNGTLYFYQPGGGPPSGVVEYKARNWAFDLRGKSGINLVGLTFIGCEPATGNASTSNCTIDNIRASYMNHSVLHKFFKNQGHGMAQWMGIKFLGTGNVVKNSEFKWSANQVVWAGNDNTVENNLFHHIGYDGMWGAPVSFWGDDNINNIKVLRNTMYTLGRGGVDNGFAFTHGTTKNVTNIEIAYNDIYDFSKLNHDGGAFYSWGYQNMSGMKIHHNWMHDLVSFKFPDGKLTDGIMAAIYFDMGSGANVGGTPISVHHNVFWNVGVGNNWTSTELTDVYTLPYCGTCGYFPAKLPANYYNNTFSSAVKTYVTYQNKVIDVMRNNISTKELNFAWGGAQSNIANAILMNTNPQFSGGDLKTLSGLYFRPSATSPARDAGVAIPGITDGSVGTPDIGAYEYGGVAWVPGYKAVAVTTPSNTPPVVSITAPAANAAFNQGVTVNISANASDNGSITRVEFFNGATKIGEDLTAPYTFAWASVPAGTHNLTAKATDNQSAATTSAVVKITVTPVSVPVVSITSPANNASITTGSNVTISANATDSNGSISKVEFFSGTTKLGEDTSSPYSFTWTSPAAGSYALTAKATDNDNSTTTSAVVNIVVGQTNAIPIVALTAPANYSTFTVGDPINLTATASDANGSVTKVEFFDGTTKLGEDATSPYSFAWANAPQGTRSVTAKATDNQGATAVSSGLSIIVASKTVADNKVPVVTLTGPGQNTTFTAGQSVDFSATASDSDGSIIRVEFLVDGVKVGEAASAPYAFTWKSVEPGVYKVVAVAWDDKSGVTTTSEVTISVVLDSTELPAEGGDQSVGIPRFFSPNSDGNGDLWIWANDPMYANAAVTVYTRAGKSVFTSSAYANNWDGTSSGTALQDGDYYYVIRLQNGTELRGAVRIIR